MNLISKYTVLLFVCIWVVFSCGKEIKPEKPKNLIPEKEFTEILLDMFVINSAKGVNKKVLEENGLKPEAYIYEKYQIDSLQFVKSNEYYAFDSKKYAEILNNVKQNVENQKKIFEKQLEEEEAENKRRLDSIRALNIKIRDSIKGNINREFQEIKEID
ncbi:DUF4296 domain-containing protein [Paucihalobacter ruber]|uniref:DUF4296 domain-containing protein n=1 Tax=Paucihalobacter ruber TaxID=2567861 RepID=A0A506PN62_9FLAO|nr:DUF4296 domain-containing protein [Paucihalobacter ruber]TPV34627.1 DUF4296 domain-containing protein [Paucihalobacter ruber]